MPDNSRPALTAAQQAALQRIVVTCACRRRRHWSSLSELMMYPGVHSFPTLPAADREST